MSRVLYLLEAQDDLVAIWQHVAQQSQSPAAADRLIDQFNQAAAIYAAIPEIGIPRPDLDPQVRCFPVFRYIVFYVPADEGIEIIQVIHGARDIPAHFRRPGTT